MKKSFVINGSTYEMWEGEYEELLSGHGDHPPFLMKYALRVQDKELEVLRKLVSAQREVIKDYERLANGSTGASGEPRQRRKRKVQARTQSTESEEGET